MTTSESKTKTEDHGEQLPMEMVVWYHQQNDDVHWDKGSYTNLCNGLPNKCAETVSDIAKIYASFHNNVTAGMFFVMKKGIFPMWEDPGNVNGGVWSFKIPKQYVNEVWLKLTAEFIGQTLVKDKKMMEYLNGISVSNKISSSVIKIWSKSKNLSPDIFVETIPYLDPSTLLFRPNKKYSPIVQRDINIIIKK
jgi:hypothetical protein